MNRAASSLRAPARVSAACLALAALSFVGAWVLAVLAADDIDTFFYEPRVIAVTHTFTLGWISLTIIGVLYQFVPSLTKQPLRFPRLAGFQVGLFAFGASGMISHFWIGHLVGMAWSAGTLLLSILLLLAELLPALWRAPQRDATVVGIAAALIYFAATAVLGMLYAVDKVAPFLGGSVLSNIAAHAHLGMLGWITLTICAVSYRMVAAFLQPEVSLPAAARRQVFLLIALVPALVTALLVRSRLGSQLFALGVVAAMGWYVAIIWRLLRTRRLPIDWSIAHVVAALAHLAAAATCGLLLLFAVDPDSERGSRLVIAYGVFALVGWISNFIVGMGTRMASGLTGRGSQPLLSEAGRAAAFFLLNAGIIAVAGAALAADATWLRFASLGPLTAGVLFASALVRRLRRRAPHPSAS